MNSMKKIILALAIPIVLLLGVYLIGHWMFERAYVGPDEALMVINKFGDPLPADRIVVPAKDNHYKGVQEELRGPGRYFLNPLTHDWKVVPLQKIGAGDPTRWLFDPDGHIKDKSTIPMIGLVALKEGKAPPPGMDVVDAGYKGIQREVLTPGTYKINPQQYEVIIDYATVVPPGSVGVVTRLTGDSGIVESMPLSTAPASTQPTSAPARLVSGPTQRGILRSVLQPGIYYLNPRLMKVNIVPVGYDAITLEHQGGNGKGGRTAQDTSIRFYSSDGYQIEADFTVVWGRTPTDAPNIVANIGGVDQVRDNVIEPAMKAACQNEGARYTAKELIQGSTRSAFQDALSESLEKHMESRNVNVLLALIRNITVRDNTGKDQTNGLLATIQQTNIEIEKDLTNQQKTITATKKAALEQEEKLIDIARETVSGDTKVKTAGLQAEGAKKAAEIDAQRELDVADIEKQIAELDAKRTEILGRAAADVERMKNEAEAKGAKLMIDAFGTPQAYNMYIFAKYFEPKDLRLIFAGPGTFWTDLKSFEQVGASQMIQAKQDKK
jgi:regulator of protease activity HflC (stomatin/prohibitin superfamily)